MRITDLHVEGFGVWSGLALDELAEGLSVFYGPNEAGKTTLMQFMRSVLYGFSPQRRARYMPPLRGDRAGGSLNVHDRGRTYRILRHAGAKAPEGRLQVVSADGTPLAGDPLRGLLSDVDEATFNNVFAVGLSELQQLDTLSNTDAARKLFQLSAGLDRVSLVEVNDELTASRLRILAPAEEPSLVAQLVTRRDKLIGEIQQLGAQSSNYARLARKQRRLNRDLTTLESDATTLENRLRASELAEQLQEAWRERNELDEQLAVLGRRPNATSVAIERLDTVNERLEKGKARLAEIRRRRKMIVAEGRSLAVDQRLERQRPKIEVLLEQQSWISGEEEELARLNAEIDQIMAQLGGEQRRLGLEGVDVGVRTSSPSEALSKLRPAARALRSAQARHGEISREIRRSEETERGFKDQISAALSRHAQSDLTQALEGAGSHVSRLRRRAQLDERIGQLKQHRVELEDQSSHLARLEILPLPVLIGLGGVFVLGVVMILAGLFMPSSIIGTAGWTLSILGLAGTASAAATKFLLERSASQKIDVCHKQLDLLALQLTQARDERDALDSQLPPGSGSIVNRLQEAEAELDKLEELLPLDARRHAAATEKESAARRAADSQSELQEARVAWKRSLEAAGIPGDLTPKQARRLIEGTRTSRDLSGQLRQRRDEVSARERLVEAFAKRVRETADELGMHSNGHALGDRMSQLRDAVDSQRAAAARRTLLASQNGRLGNRQKRLSRTLRNLASERQDLLREAGVDTESQYRSVALENARRQSLEERRAAIHRQITAALAGNASEEQLSGLIEQSNPAQAAVERQHLARRLDESRKRHAALLEQRGRLDEQRKTLVADRRLGRRQLELAEIETQLDNSLRRWQVLAATDRLLKTVRQRYEQERQPETLREASVYLEKLTQGRYRRAWTPLGEDALCVDDANGQSLAVEVLSRGTREQLFLSLRLALIASFAERGVKLPLVMDDLLVNFDADRAKAAATVLRDFASGGHQLLVFTCHRHIAKLFRSLRVSVHELPDASKLDASTVAYGRDEEAKKPENGSRKQRASARTTKAKRDGDEAVEPAASLIAPSEPQSDPALITRDTLEPAFSEPHDLAAPGEADVTQATSHLIWNDSGAEEFAGEFAERVVRPLLDPDSADRAMESESGESPDEGIEWRDEVTLDAALAEELAAVDVATPGLDAGSAEFETGEEPAESALANQHEDAKRDVRHLPIADGLERVAEDASSNRDDGGNHEDTIAAVSQSEELKDNETNELEAGEIEEEDLDGELEDEDFDDELEDEHDLDDELDGDEAGEEEESEEEELEEDELEDEELEDELDEDLEDEDLEDELEEELDEEYEDEGVDELDEEDLEEEETLAEDEEELDEDWEEDDESAAAA